MRRIGWLLLILFGLGWLANDVSLAEIRTDAEIKTGWRRTADGWEHTSRWTPEAEARPPALHPVVVGLLEMFLALAALIGLSEDTRRPKGEKSGRILRSLARIGRPLATILLGD